MTKFVRCHQCNIEISGDQCKFAIHTDAMNGEKHKFCCVKCAEQYEKKKKE